MCFGKRGRRCVFRTESQFTDRKWPLDSDRWIQRIDLMLPGRRVRLIAEIDHCRSVHQGQEGMTETFGQEDGVPRYVVQHDGLPSAVGGGTVAAVHHHIKNLALDAGHILGLARWDIGVVDAPQDSAGRNRAVRLGQPEGAADRPDKCRLFEPLQKEPPVVAVNGVLDQPGTIDAETFYPHGIRLALAKEGPDTAGEIMCTGLG